MDVSSYNNFEDLSSKFRLNNQDKFHLLLSYVIFQLEPIIETFNFTSI